MTSALNHLALVMAESCGVRCGGFGRFRDCYGVRSRPEAFELHPSELHTERFVHGGNVGGQVSQAPTACNIVDVKMAGAYFGSLRRIQHGAAVGDRDYLMIARVLPDFG